VLTLSAICGVRVGFHLGAGNAEAAFKSTLLVVELAFWMTLLCGGASVYWGRQSLEFMTSDADVQRLTQQLLPPVCFGALGMIVVECLSAGCFTSQGRVKLAAYITSCFSLPVTIGLVALFLYLEI